MIDTLFTVDLHEPQQARYIYVDEDTGDLHLMIPICGGEEIGIDNTCQSTVELKNFMGGGAPGKSAKDSLALYQKALEQDLQLLPVGNEKRKAKTKRLEQVKEFSKLIEKWKRSIPGGFYNHYTSGIKKLMEARTNFHSMLLRPQVQDTFLRAAGYVFSVKRNDESKLYNTLKSLIFEEYQLVGAKQLLSDAVKKQMATDSNTDPEKRLSNMLKCCEEQCQNLFQIQNVNFHKPSGRYKDQDISLDINFLENILGYDDGEDVLDYLSEVIDACVENLDTMVDLPPHRNLKNPAKRNEEFSVLTQFLLGQINIYCYSKGLSTQNFADAFEVEGDTLYRVLSLRLQQTINLGADIERTIFNVINENYSKFGLSEPLSLERQQEIINKFRRQYKIIYGSPHYDEFMLLDTSIKGKFHTHQGRMTTPLINVLGLENVLDDLPESIASLLDADFPASLSHKNNIEATVELQHADFENYLIELINNKQYAVAARYLLCKVDDKYYCEYIRLESFPFFETDDAEKIMGLYDKMILESDSTAQIIKTIEMFDLDFNFSVVLDSPRRPLIGLAYLEYCKNNNISLTNKELDVLLEMLTSKECIVDTSKGYIKGILEAYEFYNVSLSRPEALAILLKNYTDSYSENVKNKINGITESNKDILSDKRVLEGVLPRLESLRKYYELVEVHGVKLENSNDDATNSFLKLALTSEKSIIRSQEWTNNEMEMAIILIKLGIKFTTIASDAITVDIRYSRYLQIKFKYIQLISTKGINCARVFEDLFENARIKNQNLIDVMKLSRKYGLGVAESNTVSYIKAFWDQDTKYEYWQLEPELMADADILPSLQTAVNKGDLKLIKCLITKNQDNVNATVKGQDNQETSLLNWAIKNKNNELAVKLIDLGADCNSFDADGYTSIHNAVSFGALDVLNKMIERNIDINAKDKDGKTALFYVAELGYAEVEAKADMEIYVNTGATPILEASLKGKKDIVKTLIDAGADVNTYDNEYRTPLIGAAYNGHTDVVEVLLAAGANIEAYSHSPETPLCGALVQQHWDTADILIRHGADTSTVMEDGYSPLSICVHYDNLAMLQSLLDAGASPDGDILRFAIEKKNPKIIEALLLNLPSEVVLEDKQIKDLFRNAAYNGYNNIVNILLNQGISPDLAVEGRGCTPLWCAACNGHIDTVRILLEASASLDLKITTGETPLFMATQHGHTDVIEILLDSGASPNICADDGASPLLMAAQKGNINDVRLLVNAAADLELATEMQGTPLSIAIRNNYANTAMFLMESGADVNFILEDDGSTPLYLSVENNNLALVKKLLKAGAKFDDTALKLAIEKGHIDIIDTLSKASTNLNILAVHNEDLGQTHSTERKTVTPYAEQLTGESTKDADSLLDELDDFTEEISKEHSTNPKKL